jgi:hypothetical protein
MSRILIPKRKDQKDDSAPAWWTMGKRVYVRCPNCGAPASLAHEVSDNGEANPSIWHQCGEATGKEDWHIYGTLENWVKL